MALLANDDGQEWPSYSGGGRNRQWVYSPHSSSTPTVWPKAQPFVGGTDSCTIPGK
jgi:hypothetical protein